MSATAQPTHHTAAEVAKLEKTMKREETMDAKNLKTAQKELKYAEKNLQKSEKVRLRLFSGALPSINLFSSSLSGHRQVNTYAPKGRQVRAQMRRQAKVG